MRVFDGEEKAPGSQNGYIPIFRESRPRLVGICYAFPLHYMFLF